MSSVVTTVPPPAMQAALKPRFWWQVRGELFKILHQRLNWVMLPVLYLLSTVRWPALLVQAPGDEQYQFAYTPYERLHGLMDENLGIFRVFVGFYLIIVTARAIGLDYQQGTIRIILARGVGRLQLLFAKVLALGVVALAVTVGALLLNMLLALFFVQIIAGNLNALKAINGTFWADTFSYMLTVLISMGVTILLAVATTVVGRSLVVGLAVALVFFPADNIGTEVLYLLSRITLNTFWLQVTAYLLGPNLNVMPGKTVANYVDTVGAAPLVPVDGNHTLLIALMYAIIFAALAITFTALRDVQE